MKILLVDDEERLLQNLAFYFEDEDCTVTLATSGEEALSKLRQGNIEIAIVDMRLPGIDGNEVIRTAMAEKLLDKFLIHTGSTDYFVPADLLASGISAKNVFLKPVEDMGVLVDGAERLLAGKL